MMKSSSKKKQLEEPQFLKDRHFYKPEEFIWNNPFRSSSRLYRYFHASNEHYFQTKAKQIDKLTREDKENQEMIRISEVLQRKSKSRQLLKKRQQSRVALQNKSLGMTTDSPICSKTVKSIRFISPLGSTQTLEHSRSKTLKSIKTLKQLDQHLSQLPSIQPSSASLTSSLPRLKDSLQKTGFQGKTIGISFNLKKKEKAVNLQSTQ